MKNLWRRYRIWLVLAMLLSLILAPMYVARELRISEQHQLATIVAELGGSVEWDWRGEAISISLGSTSVSDEDIASLTTAKHLRALDLDSTSISDVGLAHIAQLEELTFLNLNGTHITDTGVSQLKDHPNLRRLFMSYTAITDKSVASLSSIRTLETLGITYTGISEQGSREIEDRMPHLTNLIYIEKYRESDASEKRGDIN